MRTPRLALLVAAGLAGGPVLAADPAGPPAPAVSPLWSAYRPATPLPSDPGPVLVPPPPLVMLSASPASLCDLAPPTPPSRDVALIYPKPPRRFDFTRVWGSADFFYGATQGDFLPPLVTLAPAGTAAANAGALYRGNTVTLLGGERLGQNTRPGFKLNAGYWLDDVNGGDFGFFFLGTTTAFVNGATAPGGVILSRPAVNGTTGENIAFPLGTAGPAAIAAHYSTNILGLEKDYRRALYRGSNGDKIDLIAGYRYVKLTDDVEIYQSQGALAPSPATIGRSMDRFRTQNNFHGAQVGLASRCDVGGGFSLDLLGKVAFGVTVADADVAAGTTSAGVPGVSPNGVLVGPTNSGSQSKDFFAVVPEAGVKLGYSCSENLRFSFGYSFLYWSKVRRAPDQIDLTLVGTGRPGFRDETRDVWVQGFTAGLDYKY